MSKKEILTGSKILAKNKQNSETAKLVREALEIEAQIAEYQLKIKELQKAKKPIEEFFDEAIAPGEFIQTEAGKVSKSVSNSYGIKPEKYLDLKNLFKRKIDNFVTEKLSYGCTPALRKLVLDDDYEFAGIVRDAVEIVSRSSIKFEDSK